MRNSELIPNGMQNVGRLQTAPYKKSLPLKGNPKKRITHGMAAAKRNEIIFRASAPIG